MKLVGGGSVINGATLFSFSNDSITGCTKRYLNMTVDDIRKGSSKIYRFEAKTIKKKGLTAFL